MTQTISRDRYLRLLEDAAILRQIEDLVDHGFSDRELSGSVKEIIYEMRASRDLDTGSRLGDDLDQMNLESRWFDGAGVRE